MAEQTGGAPAATSTRTGSPWLAPGCLPTTWSTQVPAERQPRHRQQAHDSIAGRAVAALTRWGITPARQPWPPPAESLALRSPRRQGQRAAYPHELREGEHGFWAESCLGASALVRLTADPGPDRYIADLNALKGSRVLLGNFSSPPAVTQTSLF